MGAIVAGCLLIVALAMSSWLTAIVAVVLFLACLAHGRQESVRARQYQLRLKRFEREESKLLQQIAELTGEVATAE